MPQNITNLNSPNQTSYQTKITCEPQNLISNIDHIINKIRQQNFKVINFKYHLIKSNTYLINFSIEYQPKAIKLTKKQSGAIDEMATITHFAIGNAIYKIGRYLYKYVTIQKSIKEASNPITRFYYKLKLKSLRKTQPHYVQYESQNPQEPDPIDKTADWDTEFTFPDTKFDYQLTFKEINHQLKEKTKVKNWSIQQNLPIQQYTKKAIQKVNHGLYLLNHTKKFQNLDITPVNIPLEGLDYEWYKGNIFKIYIISATIIKDHPEFTESKLYDIEYQKDIDDGNLMENTSYIPCQINMVKSSVPKKYQYLFNI